MAINIDTVFIIIDIMIMMMLEILIPIKIKNLFKNQDKGKQVKQVKLVADSGVTKFLQGHLYVSQFNKIKSQWTFHTFLASMG